MPLNLISPLKLAARDETPNVAVHQPLDLPEGYSSRPDGIVTASEGDPIWICSPIAVLAQVRSQDNDGWGRLIQVIDPDGKPHQIIIEDQELVASHKAAISRLVSRGLRMAPGRKGQEAVIELLTHWISPERVTTVDRSGWTDDKCTAFIIGTNKTFGTGSFMLCEGHMSPELTPYRESGSLDEWRDHVAALCKGNPLLLFAVSHAFTGPLLQFLGLDLGGGFHLRGASSSGKSTILRAAASVWGGLDFVESWNATANGLEAVAASRNSTFLPLDEIAEVSARALDDASYMLANGKGRRRLTSKAELQQTRTWKLSLLSTGEISMRDKLQQAGIEAQAGQDIRILDIEADAQLHGAFDALHAEPHADAFVRRLLQNVAMYHGTAGPEFIRTLLHPRCKAALQEEFSQLTKWLADQIPPAHAILHAGQIARAIDRFALVALAGKTATQRNITGWGESEILSAVSSTFMAWLDHWLEPDSPETQATIDQTRSFLQANLGRFITVPKNDTAPEPMDAVGWCDGSFFYVSTKHWGDIHPGPKGQAAAKQLKRAALLKAADTGNLASKAPHSIPGRPRVYAVRRCILETKAAA